MYHLQCILLFVAVLFWIVLLLQPEPRLDGKLDAGSALSFAFCLISILTRCEESCTPINCVRVLPCQLKQSPLLVRNSLSPEFSRKCKKNDCSADSEVEMAIAANAKHFIGYRCSELCCNLRWQIHQRPNFVHFLQESSSICEASSAVGFAVPVSPLLHNH